LAEATLAGKRVPTTALVGTWRRLDWLPGIQGVIVAGKSALVVASTAAEARWIGERAADIFGDTVVVGAGDDPASVTAAWSALQTPGRLGVTTPRGALWQIGGLAMAVVLEEGRRAMKDRQTPTIHVREMIRTRSMTEGINTAFLGPTPSLELLAAGAAVVRVGRPWGLVEVVDRSGEPRGRGMLSERVVAALRATTAKGEPCFVLTGQRGVERVVAELESRLGPGRASAAPGRGPVTVGTERDLAGLEPVALAVASDADGLLEGTGYRAGEEAIRILARLGNTLRQGRGHRMMLQTEDPASPLLQALRRGDPMPFLEEVLVERARLGLPPSSEMMALEVRGSPEPGILEEVQSLGAEVHGPMTIEGGRRWLLSGNLTRARVDLRSMAGRWRERGLTIRIDADPIDI
jgi:primosomal protein N'